MNKEQIKIMRWLRSHGLQNADIAKLLGMKSHQNVSYYFRKFRSAFFDKEELIDSNGGGVVSLLVGYVSDPPPPSDLTDQGEQDHSCPHYCQVAAYAQLEDLPKHQKIAVLLALLAEVEQE